MKDNWIAQLERISAAIAEASDRLHAARPPMEIVEDLPFKSSKSRESQSNFNVSVLRDVGWSDDAIANLVERSTSSKGRQALQLLGALNNQNNYVR
jgi:hypothetical protein